MPVSRWNHISTFCFDWKHCHFYCKQFHLLGYSTAHLDSCPKLLMKLTKIWLAETPLPGGHSHWKVVWGRAAPETHLFNPFSRSWDPTWIFWKNLAFQDQFSPIVSSQDTNFSKNLSGDPSFKPKNQFRRPYFWKPGRRVPTKIFGDYPPPPGPLLNDIVPVQSDWQQNSLSHLHLSLKVIHRNIVKTT